MDTQLKEIIAEGLNTVPTDFEALDKAPEEVWDFSSIDEDGELKSIIAEAETQAMICGNLGSFFKETSEMTKLFNSENHYLEEGQLELFQIVLRQIKNKTKKAKDQLQKDITKKQIPNHQRIQLLKNLNKDFKVELGKLDDLITATENLKVSRDKIKARGLDIKALMPKAE